MAGKFRRPDINARSVDVPLNWKISHADRSVEAAGTGHVGLQDIEGYFDDLMVSGALPYRKLFDTTHATSTVSDADMMLLGARMSAYKGLGPLGPLAIVAPTSALHAQAMLFAALAPADRPLKIFKTVAAARKWLDAPPEGEEAR
ncbi:MAG: hypothetical protein Q8L22_01475 [Reyranella sp.]|nr:hypothetical protein [Reyranella sp.]